MGLSIDRESFGPEDHARFAKRLRHNVQALRRVLERPGFGQGPRTLGAELELSLVDAEARPLPLNRTVLARAIDPNVQLELDRFNLEYNTNPVAMEGHPFSSLQHELEAAVARLDRAASTLGGRVACIGILPTLREGDLDRHSMTDIPRFRVLSRAVRELRGAPSQVHISGDEPLRTAIDDVTMEGAATSFQVHLRVEPAEFARVYNAAQAATALVLAISGNSPFFLGHKLWSETRIALFKQAVDERTPSSDALRLPSRVGFGHGWVRQGAWELFAEAAELFTPFIPLCSDEDPEQTVARGGVPALHELRLHMGTVWRWNRPVYDPADGGHLRIELRALPSGPTALDGAANAALLIGLALGLQPDIDHLLAALPFEHAHSNFYRAAEHGFDAQLVWPSGRRAPVLEPSRVPALFERLLPVAQRGLLEAGVETSEVERLLAVIAGRVRARRSGATWQREMLERLEPELGRQAALCVLTQRYLELSKTGAPVHTWEV